jgi:hypothetical protein
MLTTRCARAILLAVVCMLQWACGDAVCPSGLARSPVYNRYGQTTNDYVCVPAAPNAASALSTETPKDAESTASCDVGDQGTLDVQVLARVGPPPALGGAPPDGRYVLVQADLYDSEGGAAPFDRLRAAVVVTGAKLALAAQITSPSLEPVESITTTLTGGILTKACPAGGAAAALVPGLPGATERADVGWDGRALYLVLQKNGGEIALLFASV